MRPLVAVLLTAIAAAAAADEVAVELDGAGPDGQVLRYLARLPDNAAEPWPLLVFLHGRGEIGGDLDRVKVHGPVKAAPGIEDFPFLVVAPHLAVDGLWQPERVMAAVDDARRRWSVDPDRIYLTGLSLGGHGTWTAAAAHPDVFAAIAPVSGWGDPETACVLGDLPIWSFHGVLDDIVPASAHQAMVDAVRACGGAPGLTLYPDLGHDAWTETYAGPRLYSWLLSHERDNDSNKK